MIQISESRALAVSLIAFGCVSGAAQCAPRPNAVGEQVAALPEAQRRILLARVLQREGERCPAVTRTFFQGSSSDGAVFWSVACDGGKDWQVMIANNPGGEGKILECAVLKLMGGPFCFAAFKR